MSYPVAAHPGSFAGPTRATLPALTGIRFFAAMHVVFYHYVPVVPPPFRGIVHNGYMAVGLFFVLSGFVLACTSGDRRLELRKFWIARLARIYPAYLLAFLLMGPAVVVRWTRQNPGKLASNGLAAVFLLQGWFTSWTYTGWDVWPAIVFFA